MPRPNLIIVTGLPASGKSTVAAYLAKRLGIQHISKDGYKELLFDELGIKDRLWSQQLGKASIALLFQQTEAALRLGYSVVIESNFNSSLDTKPLRALIRATRARSVQILCHAQGRVLVRRFSKRARTERHPGHADAEHLHVYRDTLLQGKAQPLTLSTPLIELDTTNWKQVHLRTLFQQVHSLLDDVRNT